MNQIDGRLEAGPRGTEVDRSALEALYRAEHRGMVDLAHLLVGDPGVAEELVHDAFVRICRRVGDLEQPGAYLRTIVVNLCQDHHRHAARARRRATSEAVAVALPPGIPLATTTVWIALQALPERQRTAVVLRYFLDLSTDDIAAAIGARPATVRSLVHRGLAALKQEVPHGS